MPKLSDLKTSKYLRKEDVDPAKQATITGYEQVNMAQNGDPEELKWVLKFDTLKPLALNVTNGTILADIFGSDDFDDWVGKPIVLFNDKTVVYNGRVGGTRIKAVEHSDDSDVPF